MSAVYILAFQVRFSSQRASVKPNKSPSQRVQPTLTSHGFSFWFVAAEENGGNFGGCAEEVREQGGRPADNRGQTAEGRFSHTPSLNRSSRHRKEHTSVLKCSATPGRRRALLIYGVLSLKLSPPKNTV